MKLLTSSTFPILFLAGLLISSMVIENISVTAAESKPTREVLIERPVELPDKAFNILVRTIEWPVGYKSKMHTHKGPGPRYVLSGNVRIDDQGEIGEYSAGESFWHAGGFPHTAENISDSPTKVLIIELLPNDR